MYGTNILEIGTNILGKGTKILEIGTNILGTGINILVFEIVGYISGYFQSHEFAV